MATPVEHIRVELPAGNHATLRLKVSVRGRKALERTMIPAAAAQRRLRRARSLAGVSDSADITPSEQLSYTEKEIESLQRFEMAGVLATLVQWTLDDPLPRSIDDVEDWDPEVYEPIAKIVRPHVWQLLGIGVSADDAVKENPDGSLEKDLDSPTGPSSGSENGDSAWTATPRHQLSETSTTPLPDGTGSIASEVDTPV
jgi:hypothetical protein